MGIPILTNYCKGTAQKWGKVSEVVMTISTSAHRGGKKEQNGLFASEVIRNWMTWWEFSPTPPTSTLFGSKFWHFSEQLNSSLYHQSESLPQVRAWLFFLLLVTRCLIFFQSDCINYVKHPFTEICVFFFHFHCLSLLFSDMLSLLFRYFRITCCIQH